MSAPFVNYNSFAAEIEEFKRGFSPSFLINSPSPLKERGTQGVR
jgi:hypothetical protein